jgi:hypothetical protein
MWNANTNLAGSFEKKVKMETWEQDLKTRREQDKVGAGDTLRFTSSTSPLSVSSLGLLSVIDFENIDAHEADQFQFHQRLKRPRSPPSPIRRSDRPQYDSTTVSDKR